MIRLYLFLLIVSLFVSCKSGKSGRPPLILQEFLDKGAHSILPDFSYAGYEYGETEIPDVQDAIFNVVDYGAVPNDNNDDSTPIQAAVNDAVNNGGGVVFFPPGVFHVNMDSSRLGLIEINGSNIVLRGSGSGKDGTTIFSGNPTTQDENPWLSPFIFHTGLNLFGTDRFYSIEEASDAVSLTQDLLKGERALHLETTAGMKKGDILLLAMSNTNDDGDLMWELMQPLTYDTFQTSYLNAGIDRKSSFQWPVEVDEVIDHGTVLLKQPARRDIKTRFNAKVAIFPMLSNIGIEHFRFDCAYKGGYEHHLSPEHDYGWGAICLHRTKHSWVRDVHFDNYTQNLHLINSRNVTVENLTINGKGHYSVKMYNSSDNLVQNINVEGEFTHGPGLEGACFGNVYRKIELAFPAPIDLHGIAGPDFCPPMYNLYEEISNLTQFAGGGAPSNIPHSGEYNTFWGLKMSGFDDNGYRELFYSWIWRQPKQFHNDFHIDCHKLYLRSILVGIYSTKHKLSIEHKSEDRCDDWIYVEGLNKKMNLPSLYRIQLKHRLDL
ncbi:glycosyl hydrolase family 28-related protein [Thermophagus sp. OGC60D27]|uniref:glycosyl hydrolase family 28-related protein n=1 Tax=Thermophagus sp. OGC60D27 TaxID=3458415 RepID=UPI004037A65B